MGERHGHAEQRADSARPLNLGAAAETLRRALDLAEQRHLVHFESWAAARLASVLVAGGDLQGAETHVTRALSVGTPFAHYEDVWQRRKWPRPRAIPRRRPSP